ncbi:type II secretion system GspH family protein [Patescibacteria group bacterium]|nr:type II secretion system GspH family protein [Patescibacteria group bacterium]MBU1673611.1 type II secretion system GspH family protein [Patescibacteria group bacterium]MBU1963901.1 type II secretion system GspH family protein [Patescibacteria group bacterium]
MRNKKGFTLIELLIVIAIIALLATLAIISLTTAQRKARDTKRLADVKSIQSSVELFFSDNADYPTTGIAVPPAAGFRQDMSTYMQVPNPPNNDSNYVYAVTNDGTTGYVVRGTLEDTGHEAMNNSATGTIAFGAGATQYVGVQWTNEAAYTAFSADFTCAVADSGLYCATD